MVSYKESDRIDVELREYGTVTARFDGVTREKARRIYYKGWDEGDHTAVIQVNGRRLCTIREIEHYLGGARSKEELTVPMTFSAYGWYGKASKSNKTEEKP